MWMGGGVTGRLENLQQIWGKSSELMGLNEDNQTIKLAFLVEYGRVT